MYLVCVFAYLVINIDQMNRVWKTPAFLCFFAKFCILNDLLFGENMKRLVLVFSPTVIRGRCGKS